MRGGRDRERERDRERQRDIDVREKQMGCLPYTHQPGTESAALTQVGALTQG